jgi:signal transduction histidine kinase
MKIYVSKNVPKIINCDPNKLMQIIFNLVNNSIKFTNKGFINIKIEI